MKFYISIDVADEKNINVVTGLRITGNSLVEVLSKLPLAVKEVELDLETLMKEPELDLDDIPF